MSEQPDEPSGRADGAGPATGPATDPTAMTGTGIAAQPEATDTPDARTIPEATVARLSTYLRTLTALVEDSMNTASITTVSSEELAALAGVNSAKLRKDLSYLGSYGIRGVGYDVNTLSMEIARTLGVAVHRTIALVGVGNLGQALAGYDGFASRGFRIGALLDNSAALVGSTVHGLPVRHVSELPDVVAEHHISIAVIATPAEVAQHVCDRVVAAGVRSILNFAPVVLNVPADVDLRKVDLAAELQILSFHEHRKTAGPAAESAAGI